MTARRFANPDIAPAVWPFAETVKREGDVVITSIRPSPDRNPEGRDNFLARFMRAGKAPTSAATPLRKAK
jgi:hypothetical protein